MLFSPEVCEKLGAYVYRLVDPRNGLTFYVGKGTNNRVFEHINGALGIINQTEEFNEETQPDKYSLKFQTIREIKNANLEVIHIIHRHGLTDDEAFAVEAALIDVYYGLTNLQNGHNSNEFGIMHSSQIISLYTSEEVKFDKNDNVLIIKLKEINESNLSIYDQTRFAWKVGPKADKSNTIVTVVKGKIKMVFKPSENQEYFTWKDAAIPPKEFIPCEGRKYFEGVEDNSSEYLDKVIPSRFRQRGMASPILYSY